jgi:hypothetical protein
LAFFDNFQSAHELTTIRKQLCPICDGTGSMHSSFKEPRFDEFNNFCGYEMYDNEEECQWCAEFSDLFLKRKTSITEWICDFHNFIEALEHAGSYRTRL